MAEKLTPNGLVVGLILEPGNKLVEEPPVAEESNGNPIEDKPKRNRQLKSE